MLQAWYRYADRVGRYEAGPKAATRVAVMVVVNYALFSVVIAWPLLVDRQQLQRFLWIGIPAAMLVVAAILAMILKRFRPLGPIVTTPLQTIAGLVVFAWVIFSLAMDFPVAVMLGPLWCWLALDALAHITKVLRSAREDAAAPVRP